MNPKSEIHAIEAVEVPGSTELSAERRGGGKPIYLGKFNIGPRLGLCFLVIIMLMLAGYGLLLWQFHVVHVRGNRSTAVGQELIAVSRFQTDFFRLTASLDELAKSEDIEGLKREAKPLREVLQSDIEQTRKVISRLPADLNSDRTVLPTIEAIQSTLPSQLEKVTALGEASDWEAVRLRLANEKKPLEAEVSSLVRAVEHQVSEELASQLTESARAQQRILIIVPVTAFFTLAVAGFLGLVVTRSITQPLRSLVAGSKALAKGDFSHRIPTEGNDELASLGEVFNDMIVRLQELYRDARRSEARWRSVFENSAVGVALADLNGRFIAINPVFQKMLGYGEEELKKHCFLDITHETDRENNWTLVEELLAEKRQHFQIEKQYRRKDGSLVWVRNHVSLAPGSERVPRFLMAIVEDITERKRAEEKLRRSEAFLAEGQRLSLTGSYSWKAASNEITWSEQLYRIFEFEIGVPVTPELIRTRVHPEDRTLFEVMVEHAREERNNFEWQYRLLMPDHSIKYLHAVGHAARDRDGQLEYTAVVQDVTQRRLSEQALGKARSELARVASITSLGVLTASIAHEVNQPLSGIITNASTCLRMLSADPPNVDGARETARRTIRDGNRASEVITRLRTLYSRKDPQPELMDLNEAAREVASLSLSELQRNRVILRHELAEDLPPVLGDRVQLQQVILNLLRNASDAMSTVEDRPRDLLIKTERDEGDRVRLTVKDMGVGFTPQAADRLFEAFYTTKSDGMGIGLSLSRSIIEAHQGCMWATANNGPGATFSFAIPCRSGDLADIETHAIQPDLERKAS